MKTIKTPKDITKDFVEKSNKAKQQKQYLNLLNSCSETDKSAVAMLEKLDIASGGQLDRLVAVYRAIRLRRKE